MKALNLKEPMTRVVGVISPIEWDEEGNAKNFSIFTEWGEDYIILNKKHTKVIERNRNKVVEAYGKVFKNEDSEYFIKLSKVIPMGDPSGSFCMLSEQDPWYEELPLKIPQKNETFLELEGLGEHSYVA